MRGLRPSHTSVTTGGSGLFADACRGDHKYGNMVSVKTTLEIPDALFRRAKARAAERGQALKTYVTEAIQEKLAGRPRAGDAQKAPWMKGFGQLRSLRHESERLRTTIDEEFEIVEPEDRQ